MTKTFEQQIQDLEQITQKMGEPNLDLETGLKLFSKGTEISQNCQEILNNAEQKIEYILNKDEN
jgi:exodeoxyribonuclease VII small subunit